MGESRKKGAVYEQKAAGFLEDKGYRVLQRNFYSKYGEIDLIARDGEYLVFLEVKYRASGQSGHPLEAVGAKKQQRIKKAARYYLWQKGLPEDTACRFDVIGILGNEFVHVADAFY